MASRECETCIKRKTVYCPTSIECMSSDDKPYYQNRIMLLEENQELKKRIEEYQKDIKDLDNQSKRAFENMQLNQLKVCNMIKQQKEFIKYLKSMLDDENDIFSVVRVKDVLRKNIKDIKGVGYDKRNN